MRLLPRHPMLRGLCVRDRCGWSQTQSGWSVCLSGLLRASIWAVGQLTSDDIPDVRDAIMLQLGAGGRGFRPMAEDCYGLYDGAWAQSAHR